MTFIIGTRSFETKEEFESQAVRQMRDYLESAYSDLHMVVHEAIGLNFSDLQDDPCIEQSLSSVERWVNYSRQVFDLINGKTGWSNNV